MQSRQGGTGPLASPYPSRLPAEAVSVRTKGWNGESAQPSSKSPLSALFSVAASVLGRPRRPIDPDADLSLA